LEEATFDLSSEQVGEIREMKRKANYFRQESALTRKA
jgi:hypothetical protein